MRNLSCDVRSDFQRLVLGSLFAFGLVLAASCGDDGDDGDGAAGAGGGGGGGSETCHQAGFTETGCTCVEGGPMGSRTCMQNGSRLTWSACTCPRALGPNECEIEGRQYRCHLCVGETEQRIVTCQDGMFDCSCPDGSMPIQDAGMAEDAAAGDGG